MGPLRPVLPSMPRRAGCGAGTDPARLSGLPRSGRARAGVCWRLRQQTARPGEPGRAGAEGRLETGYSLPDGAAAPQARFLTFSFFFFFF